MLRTVTLFAALVLLLAILAGCIPTRSRASGPDAGTSSIEPSATADLTRGWVQPAIPTATAIAWKSFTSPKYGYRIAYPADRTVAIESAGAIGDAREVERVIFKRPSDGTSNESSAVTVEAAQRAYSRPVQCENQTELVPGIPGCRRSLPQQQGTSEELVWFRVPTSGQGNLYFSMQLIYDDLKDVTAFAHMLQTFQSSGASGTATPSSQSGCSYKAAFLGDVTIPDSTVVAPGASFVKTWRIQNEGTCIWGYNSALHRLVFVGGDPLGSAKSIELPFPSLGQGGAADFSVPMVAPAKPGTYLGNWRLQVENGTLVGLGPNGEASLTVRIVVPGPGTPTPTPKATKNYTSSTYGYRVSYPAEWTIRVQTFTPSGPGRNPEVVLLSAPNAMWATVQIYALKGAPPIQGYENCKNLTFNGVPACESIKSDGPVPQRSLVFQKGDSYFLMDARYTSIEQLDLVEEIVLSFRFTP